MKLVVTSLLLIEQHLLKIKTRVRSERKSLTCILCGEFIIVARKLTSYPEDLNILDDY